MPPFLTFINYNGGWQSYEVHGIMLEDDYTFKQLLEVIAETIQPETPFDRFILKYQVSDTYPPIAITDDRSFNFYKELEKRETECTRYPICVNLQKKSSILAIPSMNKKIVATTYTNRVEPLQLMPNSRSYNEMRSHRV
ncbi:protein LF2 [Striga asiatica]|uniref:Protein LF2 n=1 Tax=Striga asiatica TaxID=4170 RepID=A0A5A7PJ64_STRAF|nr:protein LF2 [Striga asiatica]